MSNIPGTAQTPQRARILQTAETLFAADSIIAVSLADIADGADVSLEELEAEFPSKNELIEDVLDIRHGDWILRLTKALSAHSSPEDRLLAIFTFLERWFAEETFHRCAFVTSYGELGPSMGWVDIMVRRHKNVFDTLILDLATEAGLPHTISSSIALLADGAQVTAAATGNIGVARDARSSAALLMAMYRMEPRDAVFD